MSLFPFSFQVIGIIFFLLTGNFRNLMMDPSTHTRNLTTQCCALRHDTSNWRVRLKAGKISHVHPNSKMPAAHINSLLLVSPILNTLKFSDFCRTETNAMKGRWLNVMVHGHFKIPVSFSADSLRLYTDVRHQTTLPWLQEYHLIMRTGINYSVSYAH